MRQKTQLLGLNGAVPQEQQRQGRKSSKDSQASGDGGDADDSHAEDESVDGVDAGEDHNKAALEELGSRGGSLTAGELKAVVMGASSAEEFRRLGERIISPPLEEEGGGKKKKKAAANGSNGYDHSSHKKKLGLDVDAVGLTYTPDEAVKIENLRKDRDELFNRARLLDARNIFVSLVRQRAKHVLDHLKQTDPKGGWKDICGFDSRLAWSDEEFDEWRQSPAGERTLQTGSPESLADVDGDVVMASNGGREGAAADLLTRGMCVKKRCERHKQWVKVHLQDIHFEQSVQKQDLAKCEQEAQAVVERAVLRMWAETDNVQTGAG